MALENFGNVEDLLLPTNYEPMVNMYVNSIKVAKTEFDDKDAVSKEYVVSQLGVVKEEILGTDVLPTLDTLAEIGGYLNSEEGQTILNLGQLTTQSNDNAADIVTVQNNAQTTTTNLTSFINNETSRAQDAEKANKDLIAAEEVRARNAEGAISTVINTNLQTAKTYADDAVAVEKARAEGAENALLTDNGQIKSQMNTDRADATAYTNQKAGELEDADGVLDGKITTVASDLTSAVSTMGTNLQSLSDDLTIAYEDADTILQDQITANKQEKMDISGGDYTGDVGMQENSYIYIGDHWRITSSATRLQFEYTQARRQTDQATWVVGVPFIAP